jgi:hypothetical protein
MSQLGSDEGDVAPALPGPTKVRAAGTTYSIHPLTDQKSFPDWAYQLGLALADVGGGAEKVVEAGDDASLQLDSGKENAVKILIAGSISKALVSIVRPHKTARQQYIALRRRHGSTTAKAVVTALVHAVECKMEPGEAADHYVRRHTAAIDALRMSGLELPTRAEAALLLAGVSEAYDVVYATITDEKLTEYDSVAQAIKDDEGRQTAIASRAVALAARGAGPGPGRSGGGGGGGGGSSTVCTLCRSRGYPRAKHHLAADCWEDARNASRRPEGWKSKGDKPARAAAAVAHPANEASGAYFARMRLSDVALAYLASHPKASSDGALADTGCTEHMTPLDAALIPGTFRRWPLPRRVAIADGRFLRATGEGEMLVRSHVNGCLAELELKKVWFVPELAITLISIRRLNDAGHDVMFAKNGLATVSLGDKPVAHAISSASGFLFNGTIVRHRSQAVAAVAVPLRTWHARLMHIDSERVRQMASMVNGMQFASSSTGDAGDFCNACAIGKARRQPFRPSESEYKPMDLLVADLAGAPGDQTGYDGSKYRLVLVDRASRYPLGAHFKRKRDARRYVMEKIVYLETQTGKRLKEFGSDGGGEFINGALRKWLMRKGIKIRETFPDSSPSNGVAERKIGIVNVLTSCALTNQIIADTCVSRKKSLTLWPYAFLAAVHVAGLTPTAADSKRTPHEILFKKRPSVSHVRLFGCEAFKLTPKGEREARDGPKARPLIFVGYTAERKGYVLIDPQRPAQRIEARDVEFREAPLLEALTRSHYDEPVPRPKTQPAAPTVEADHVPVEIDAPTARSGGDVEDAASDDDDEHVEPQLPPQLAEPDRPLALNDVAAVPDRPSQTTRSGRSFAQQATGMAMLAQVTKEMEGPPEGVSTVNGPRGVATGSGPPGGTSQSHLADAPTLSSFLYKQRRTAQSYAARTGTDLVAGYAYVSIGGTLNPNEPRNEREARLDPRWVAAMDEEEAGLRAAGVFEDLDALPKGKRALGSRWVYAIKDHGRFKARLVARGDWQKPGEFDAQHLWSPTANYAAIRFVCALSAREDLELEQYDVKQAYLNGKLDEEIFMRLPSGRYVRLLRAIYGLKQAGRAWYVEADKQLRALGLTPLPSEPCIYIGKHNGVSIILVLFVDDMKIAKPRGVSIAPFIAELNKHWEVKAVPADSNFVGIRVRQDLEAGTVTLDQMSYARDYLERHGYMNLHSVATPADPKLDLSEARGAETPEERVECASYREQVGELLWLGRMTRPDILMVVTYLGTFVQTPGPEHMAALKRVARYLRGTINLGIAYSRGGCVLRLMCDSDWAGDRRDRRSRTAYIAQFADGLVNFSSHLQSCIACSSREAEYMAAHSASNDAIYLARLCGELGYPHLADSPMLRIDNEGAIALADHATQHDRTKHIDIKYHSLRERVAKRLVSVVRVGTADNHADLLTKPLPKPAFEKHRDAVMARLPGEGA